MNMNAHKNYYESFLRKAEEFKDFFKQIKSTKKNLHSEANEVTYKIAAYRDKINYLSKQIAEKEKGLDVKRKLV